jgi:hypothetical protein
MNLDLTYRAQVDLMRATALLAQGDLPAGQALLSTAAPTFSRPGADPYMRQLATDMLAKYPSKSVD